MCQLLPLPTTGWGPDAGPLPPSSSLLGKKNGTVLWKLNKLVIAATSDIQNNG